MLKYRLIVLTDPVDGMEAEYNTWYSDVHLTDLLRIPGITSAERLELVSSGMTTNISNRYLAIYNLETDDPAAVCEEIQRRSGTADMVVSPALGAKLQSGLFQVFAEVCNPT